MVELVPVLPHGRRETRVARRRRARQRLTGVAGVGAILGLTAAVVVAPMAQGSNASLSIAPAGSPAGTHVSAVTAPVVDSVFTVDVPTITHNPPPPPPPKPKSKPRVAVSHENAAGSDYGNKDCGDKRWKD